MHPEILSNTQLKILPYLSKLNRTFFLVGGTAVALHIGHRRSIDFDLFTSAKLNKTRIKTKLNSFPFIKQYIFEDVDQLHILINEVKTTFFYFPYSIEHTSKYENYFTFPSLLDLASMKAFALGRRAKWKDYVDLYFIIKDFYSIKDIGSAARKNFGDIFSEKLFRQQLAFHKDIDYSEPVEYLIKPLPDDVIRNFLTEKAIDIGI
jgi:hypothetical protein